MKPIILSDRERRHFIALMETLTGIPEGGLMMTVE